MCNLKNLLELRYIYTQIALPENWHMTMAKWFSVNITKLAKLCLFRVRKNTSCK